MPSKPPTEENIVDDLDALPIGNETEDEVDVNMNKIKLFAKSQQKQKMGLTAKEVGFATILFVFMSLPITDKLLEMVVPSSENSLVIRMFVKAILFFGILYLIVHPFNK